MIHYYKVIKKTKEVPELIDTLVVEGIDRKRINVIMKSPNDIDFSPETLANMDVNLEEAPEGTISMFGELFVPVAAVTAGLLFVATGPVAAALGAAAVGAGGITLLLSGIGVPEEQQSKLMNRLDKGEVILHVESEKKNPELSKLLYDGDSEGYIAA